MNKTLDELYELKELLDREIDKKEEEKNYPDLKECDECYRIKPTRTGQFNAGYFSYPPILYTATLCRDCARRMA